VLPPVADLLVRLLDDSREHHSRPVCRIGAGTLRGRGLFANPQVVCAL